MEKKFNEETLQHEFEIIWKELEPKIQARLETEPEWIEKYEKDWNEWYKDIFYMFLDVCDMLGRKVYWELCHTIILESTGTILNSAVYLQHINDEK